MGSSGKKSEIGHVTYPLKDLEIGDGSEQQLFKMDLEKNIYTNTVCVKTTSASYVKGQTERRQIRSNRTCIEGSEGIRKALPPPALDIRARSTTILLYILEIDKKFQII
ncbi:hypothetical protein NQ318_013974 [Aromia moschata]|uniref:Uncharacterized protein n=1 Tax=Aromia moschata TaxID=1265417 RepID=A0AAV8Z0B4_9CUCU|nr:hypothetical protein NQ318_013974 [Aromia moschata]